MSILPEASNSKNKQIKEIIAKRSRRLLLISFLVVLVLVIGGIGLVLRRNQEHTQTLRQTEELLQVQEDALLQELNLVVRRSHRNFEENTSGVITPGTLESWLRDWSANKPDYIEGNLIILQFGKDTSQLPYLVINHGVRVFDVQDDLLFLSEVRSNGVVASGFSPAQGLRVDVFLRKYGINPLTDMVVLVAGQLNLDSLAHLSRAWLTFRYWGFRHEFLALLNGQVGDVNPVLRTDFQNEPPYDGLVRIGALPDQHFSLHSSLEHIHGFLTQDTSNTFLWDLRSLEEYEGREVSPAPLDGSCVLGVPFCTATHSGRISRSTHLDLNNLIDSEAKIRDLDILDSILADVGMSSESIHLLYDGDGSRSAIAGFVFLAVTGHPVRWYSNSFVEWSALTSSHPELIRLSDRSPWRTDKPELTEGVTLWASAEHAVQPPIIFSQATTASWMNQQDQRYILNPTVLPVVGSDDPNCI
jgi:thiosulfate/3-mercaptopyruvate sulfurtransferase